MDSLAAREAQPRDWPDLPDALTTVPLPRAAALVEFCLTLFNLNEFAFVD